MDSRQEEALHILNGMEVVYDDKLDPSAELREVLSNLEDAIMMLPFLGLHSDFDNMMRDKMTIYRRQIASYRALHKYLREHVMIDGGINE